MNSILHEKGSKEFNDALISLSLRLLPYGKPLIRYTYESGYSLIISADLHASTISITRVGNDRVDFREIGLCAKPLERLTVLPRGFYMLLCIPGIQKPIHILNPEGQSKIISVYIEQCDISFEDLSGQLSSTSVIVDCLTRIAKESGLNEELHFLEEFNRYGYYRSDLYDDEVFYWYPLCGLCLAATPKCASTTMLSLLSDDYAIKRMLDYMPTPSNPHENGSLKGIVHLSELSCTQIYQILSGGIAGNVNVALARDPLSRLISAYFDKVVNPAPLHYEIKQILAGMGRKRDCDEILFDDFVEAVATLSEPDFEPHIKPIALTVHPRIVKYSHIIKLESFDSDLSRLSSDVGLLAAPRASGRLHQTKKQTAELKLSSRSKMLIEKIYRLDYELFGY